MIRLLLIPLLLSAFPAAADTIKVLTGGAFKPVVMDMLADFEQQTGHKVAVQNDTAGALSQRLDRKVALEIVGDPAMQLVEGTVAVAHLRGEGTSPTPAIE